MNSPERAGDRLLRPGDVRMLFGIAASTLRAWAAADIITPAQVTAGGHRRYWESDVRDLLASLAKVAA